MINAPHLKDLQAATARVRDRLDDLERAVLEFDGDVENEVDVRLAADFVANAAKAVKRLVTSNA